MGNINYRITLTEEERSTLLSMSKSGKHSSRKVVHGLILLNSDEGEFTECSRRTNKSIADFLQIGERTVERIKKRFVEEGFEAALEDKPSTREYKHKIDGDLEARLIALSCGESPDGFSRWSLRLLAEKAVELEYIDSISHETVRNTLKKNALKPWKKVGWLIPPEQNGDFVANMENVLDVYRRPYDEKRPVVCMDESPKQLIGETKTSIEAKPGSVEKYDYEYVRNGVCNIFISNEPLAGKRFVKITERKQKKDWALFVEEIAGQYPHAEKITLVMDNYETHKPGSLYDAFDADKAKKLWDRFEFVYTPKHGSWLNMAEIELNVLMGQCLAGRIPDIEKIKTEVKAWQEARNNKDAKINWQFTTQDARIKLRRLYPSYDA